MDSGVVGSLALWGAVGSAAGSLVLSGVTGGRAAAANAATAQLFRATLALASIAVGALAWSLLTGNYALAYVADTTTRQGSWTYRLAGLWGGNGGSLLFWGWFVLLVGMWATRRVPPRGARLVATAAGGSVLVIAAVAANPFQRLAIPAIDGGGLNPILVYPAMLYHPVLLYAGHAGLVAPFALAVAGLATGGIDRAWLAATRRWMLGAWLLLGVGLVAGAHWSYVEVGWGGFWGWDPVENSGLLPWLAATAFLHAARRTRAHREDDRDSDDDGNRATNRLARRPALLPVGLAALAALPFCLSLLGAAVSRSGAAQSVHAFADATAVGRALLVVLIVAVSAVVWLSARAQRRRSHAPHEPATPPDRQALALGGGVVLLLAVALVVAVGTVFPVLARVTTGQSIDVTARYYASVVTPLAVIAVLLMGAAPTLRDVIPRLPAVLVAAVAAVVAVALLAGSGRLASIALGSAAIAAAVLAGAELLTTRNIRRVGALVAHVGVAVLLVGVAGSLLGRHSAAVVRPGGTVSLDGYTLQYRDLVLDQGAGWQRARTVLEVDRGGQRIAVLRPGLRVFSDQAAALSDVAIHATPARDLIVSVAAIDPSTSAADLSITTRPLVLFVWWGGLVAAAGGGLVLASSFWTRRHAQRGDQPATVAEAPVQVPVPVPVAPV